LFRGITDNNIFKFAFLKLESMNLELRHLFCGLACFLAFTPNPAGAQDSDLGNWLIYIGSKKISQNWNWHHEIQNRNYNAFGDLEQLLLRTGMGYTFRDKNQNLLLGYGYISSQNYNELDEKNLVNEHRIFQQYILKQTVNCLKLGHRFRLEQRFKEPEFKIRFRYFLNARLPLKIGRDNRFYLSGYNEIFLSLEEGFFDRNRLYGGLGYKLSEGINLELGYMNQFLSFSSRDQLNLIMFLNL
tara:strand:+ start:3669 stop:4397 length:729 start_codon:yes stop_codon:yes gene_type:complete